jgi:phosphoribosylaminoimidazole (AIR) synthetase
MIFILAEKDLAAAAKILKKLKEPWYQIGRVTRGAGVSYE